MIADQVSCDGTVKNPLHIRAAPNPIFKLMFKTHVTHLNLYFDSRVRDEWKISSVRAVRSSNASPTESRFMAVGFKARPGDIR